MKITEKQKEELKFQFKTIQKGLGLENWKVKLTFRDTKGKKGSVRWLRGFPKGKVATINICFNNCKDEKTLIRVLLHEFYHLLSMEITLAIAQAKLDGYGVLADDWDNLERLLGMSESIRKKKGFTLEKYNQIQMEHDEKRGKSETA